MMLTGLLHIKLHVIYPCWVIQILVKVYVGGRASPRDATYGHPGLDLTEQFGGMSLDT